MCSEGNHEPHSSMAYDKWADVVDVVQKAAAGHNTRRPLREQIDGHKEILTDSEETLAKRRRVRKERTEEEYRKAEEVQEQIATELKALTRTTLKIRRKWQRLHTQRWKQLIEAEREGKPALVHALSKARWRGPKTRNHPAARRLQTFDQWKAQGRRGGMSAVPRDSKMEQERWIITATFEEKNEPDQNAYEEARELVHSMAKKLTICDERKAAPPWSAPNELWLQLLLPNWRMGPDKAVGSCQRTLDTAGTDNIHQAAPLVAHRSRAVDISKSNGELRLNTSSAHSGPWPM